MHRSLNKTAALLALVIGALSALAGGQVLLGRLPGWNVISWLPLFNFTVGVLTILIIAPLIWRSSRYAWPAALITFGANALVLLVLQISFGDVVAAQSLAAMLLRLLVWIVILALLFFRGREQHPITR